MGRIIILVFLLLFSTLVMAQGNSCNYQFNQNQINVNYNGSAIQIPFTINLQRPNQGQSGPPGFCARAAFFFGPGNANSYARKVFQGGSTLNYTLENISPTGTLKAFGDHSGANEFLSTYIDYNQNKILQGLFKIPVQGGLPNKGLYQDVVNVTVFGYINDSAVQQGMTKQLVINVQVQDFMELSIVPVGAAYNSASTSAILNFGQLVQGQELAADLIVKANSGYRVKVGSQNNGRFKHLTQNASIPYQFYFANSLINLNGTSGNPTSVVYSQNSSPASGSRYNMKVKVGALAGNQLVGDYADTITVTVSSP